MTRIESPVVAIVMIVVLGLMGFWIFPLVFMIADRQELENYGLRRGWTLKRVWCLPIPGGRHSKSRTYYRATFVTAEGRKEKSWFEATDGEPIESGGPFGRENA
jgi:hypothetical protein